MCIYVGCIYPNLGHCKSEYSFPSTHFENFIQEGVSICNTVNDLKMTVFCGKAFSFHRQQASTAGVTHSNNHYKHCLLVAL